MKVLLTGSNGQLGRSIQAVFPKGWTLIALDSIALDITNTEDVFRVIAKNNPDVVINAAAYTAVDKAEQELNAASLINIVGPSHLAEVALACNALFFHISTDYVFDGESNHPYTELDITNPLGVYGKTKLEGEQAVIKANANSIVIRTSWVFSQFGNNFVKTMLRLGAEREMLSVVNDQFGCPTYAGDIAIAILKIIELNQSNKILPGVYHFCGDATTTWYEFATLIFNEAKEQKLLKVVPQLKPILTKDYPTLAHRPHYSVLDCQKIKNLNIELSNWKQRLSQVIHLLKGN